jgi:hypothetical protein
MAPTEKPIDPGRKGAPAVGAVLQSRARRAYEWGRLRWSLRLAPFVLVAAGAALSCGRPLDLTCALSFALLPLAVGLTFAGGSAGRGVLPGLVGGSVALALPLLVRTVGHLCLGPACMAFCLPACIVGGAIAGAVIGATARSEGVEAPFVASALLIAGLTGALGCTLGGLAGVGGMLAGALAVGAPVLLVARR